MSAHWGVPDPAEATGTDAEIRYAFSEIHRMLYARISIFTSLPLTSTSRLALQERLDEIGKTEGGCQSRFFPAVSTAWQGRHSV